MKNKIKWEIRRDKEINNDDYIPHVSDNNSSYDIIYNNYPCFVTDNSCPANDTNKLSNWLILA